MKIVYGKNHYYDIHGEEIHDGDTVLLDGRERKVLLTTDGCLGLDATNPAWIESGRAAPGEYGIYPFDEDDEPELVRRAPRA